MSDREESTRDAAEAFEGLSNEVSALRGSVDELVRVLNAHTPHDYTPTLGKMAVGLTEVGSRLAQIERHPALRITPSAYPEAVAKSGRDALQPAVDRLDQAARTNERQAQALTAIIGAARTQDQQFKWLMVTGSVALVVGLVAAPFLARLLALGLQTRVSAAVMATDRWSAGEALMKAHSAQDWRAIVIGGELVRANQTSINACRAAADKVKQAQRCTIEVAPVTK
jgi:Family of unknown function (DUF6118)